MPDERTDKRIVFRVDPKTFESWDKRRDAEGRQWQELGMELFGEWFSPSGGASVKVPLEQRAYVQEFLRMLAEPEDSPDRHARKALLAVLQDRLAARKRASSDDRKSR